MKSPTDCVIETSFRRTGSAVDANGLKGFFILFNYFNFKIVLNLIE